MIGRDRRRATGSVGDVEADHPPAAARGGNVGERCLGADAVGAVMDDDMEAVARQTPGDGAADALAGAGDEDSADHDRGAAWPPISAEASCG